MSNAIPQPHFPLGQRVRIYRVGYVEEVKMTSSGFKYTVRFPKQEEPRASVGFGYAFLDEECLERDFFEEISDEELRKTLKPR